MHSSQKGNMTFWPPGLVLFLEGIDASAVRKEKGAAKGPMVSAILCKDFSKATLHNVDFSEWVDSYGGVVEPHVWSRSTCRPCD